MPLLALLLATQNPVGFRPVDEREVPRKSESRDYEVSLVGDRVRIERRTEWVARTRREARAAPRTKPKLTLPLGSATIEWSPGVGLKVADGWLIAADAGEFGGGLFLVNAEETKIERLDSANTSSMKIMNGGIYAVQALNHLMFSYSRLVRVERNGGVWRTRLVTDLHVDPTGVATVGDHFVYTSGDFVSTLETDGTQREIYRSFFQLRLRSLAVLPTGDIWVASAGGVLRLRPKGEAYAAQRYVPTQKP